MVHSGFESTAVIDAIQRPWHFIKVALSGPETEKPMVPEIYLKHQRPAQYVFSQQVEEQMTTVE